MAGLLDGKVAIITGAGNGLGEAYAKLFAKEGAAVVVNDLGGARDGTGADVSAAQKVVNAIEAAGGRAVANGDDVPTVQGRGDILKAAPDAFRKVDIMVSDLAADHSGKILGVSSRGVREIKMLQTAGFNPGRPYTAQEVAEHAAQVFFPNAEERTAQTA